MKTAATWPSIPGVNIFQGRMPVFHVQRGKPWPGRIDIQIKTNVFLKHWQISSNAVACLNLEFGPFQFPTVNFTCPLAWSCLRRIRPEHCLILLVQSSRSSLAQSQGNIGVPHDMCRSSMVIYGDFPSNMTQVASKKLDDGAWFLLESPVVCWPLTQQEGDWSGCVDFFSGFHSTCSTCSNQNGPRVLSSTYLMVVLHHVRSI